MDNNSLKIYLEDGKIKIKGTVNLGYIGSFKDTQIEIIDSLEEIREWDIIEEYYETVLRSFYPMFNFDCAILCGAYAVLDEELAFSDWHNF